MRKFFAVFKFEFTNQVMSKPFIVLSVLAIIFIAGALSFPRLKEAFVDEEKPVNLDDEVTIGIINNAVYEDDSLFLAVSQAMPEYKVKQLDESTKKATELVEDETYNHIIVLDDVGSYTLITEAIELNSSITYRIDNVLLMQYKAYLLQENGLDKDQTNTILNAQLEADIVETGKNQENTFLYTYVMLFLLYMSIIVYGQLVATSVAMEKSSRAMEVLVTTVDPVKMMFGKVLGTGSAAICQLVTIIGSAAIFYNINKAYWGADEMINSVFDIPAETIVISIILAVLGFFVYAFIYAAIGSLASRLEDVSTSVLPITFVSIASFMLVMISMTTGSLDSLLMKIASFFPLTSPYALLVRTSMTEVAITQSIIAIGILLVTCIVIGYFAAMIYKVGVLMYGKPLKLKEIIKLIKK